MKNLKNKIFVASVLLMAVFLFSSTSFAETFKCTQVMESSQMGTVMTIKMWHKDGKDRIEASQPGTNMKTITINTGDSFYTYMPQQNMAFKMPADAMDQTPSMKPPKDFKSHLDSVGATKTGTETYDGQKCDIYEYTEPQTNSNIKLWYSVSKSFPLKMVVSNAYSTNTIYYKDIEVNTPISDDLFRIPDGVKIMGMGM